MKHLKTQIYKEQIYANELQIWYLVSKMAGGRNYKLIRQQIASKIQNQIGNQIKNRLANNTQNDEAE